MTVIYIDTKEPVFCGCCEKPMRPRKPDGLQRFCDYMCSVTWHKQNDPKKVTKKMSGGVLA